MATVSSAAFQSSGLDGWMHFRCYTSDLHFTATQIAVTTFRSPAVFALYAGRN